MAMIREQFGNITLINADCMDVMKSMPDKSYDLAIVDPPYGIKMDGGKIGGSVLAANKIFRKKDWDRKTPDREYFRQLMRVSRNQIIWGANYFISKIPVDSSCWLVWDKVNGDNNFADCELAYTSFSCAVRKFSFKWQGMFQGDMKHKEERIHPTQKPVALYKWLLQKFAKNGDKIIDTHLGSGSSCIAAHDFGFELTGIEIDSEYYDSAKKRLIEHQRQLSLF